tara:strand:+ start:348 stop:545 length:198 start_codon:yes stop_codon:yes gene_type:complete
MNTNSQVKFKEVNKAEFKAFVKQNNLTPIHNFQCQDMQDDYINVSSQVLATHEMIACQDIYSIPE